MSGMSRIYTEAQFLLEVELGRKPTHEEIVEKGKEIIADINQWIDESDRKAAMAS